ncbi:Hint domain-containing protein [Nioella aestuarii]|uniref:Hint domain-containing protein n=1 Tax=Nioella aestuarii TaxID=1662864 RepID=UPI003D7F71D9
MASWEFTSYVVYTSDGASSNWSEGSSFDLTGTLSDPEFDTTFEPGDLISGGAANGTFFGTHVDGSGNVYVVILVDANTMHLYSSTLTATEASSNLPNTLHGSHDFDTGTHFVVCFAAGTLIATPEGEKRVEALAIGDMLKTPKGSTARVKWIGRQTVSTRFGYAERLMPVRFAAGAFGNGLPHTDLTVTADHGMLVGGVVCHAGALVNGTTITRVPLSEMGDTYTVYHIETEEHEIILANGAPAETFIDNVSRRVFDNYNEFEALYGDVPEMEELPYPRAMSARQVPVQIRTQLQVLTAA